MTSSPVKRHHGAVEDIITWKIRRLNKVRSTLTTMVVQEQRQSSIFLSHFLLHASHWNYIGLDDTDSRRRMHNIHRAILLGLSPYTKFTDYPNLVRLNPSIEWKTVAMVQYARVNIRQIPRIKETVIKTVEENSDIGYSALTQASSSEGPLSEG
jgi:hypothetical protein